MRELSLHILDLARNCIEAKATRVELRMREDRPADRLEISLTDNGVGLEEEALAKVADPFYTTRTTRRVGMGLALFAATCERCGGEMRVQSERGRGTEVVGTLQLSHLDRPPLGDMGAVVGVLAAEAARVRLVYRHQVNGGIFEVDTEELQGELGEVPLSEPVLLCWLKDHVTRGLRALGSTA